LAYPLCQIGTHNMDLGNKTLGGNIPRPSRMSGARVRRRAVAEFATLTPLAGAPF